MHYCIVDFFDIDIAQGRTRRTVAFDQGTVWCKPQDFTLPVDLFFFAFFAVVVGIMGKNNSGPWARRCFHRRGSVSTTLFSRTSLAVFGGRFQAYSVAPPPNTFANSAKPVKFTH
jgi:hypothetical protein